MIEIGDIVFVQTKGICEVLDKKKNAFVGCDKSKEYFVLQPMNVTNNMMVYIPVDSNVNMRQLSNQNLCEQILNNFKKFGILTKVEGMSEVSVYESSAKSCELEKWVELLNTLLIKKSKTNKKQFSYQEQKLLNLMLSCVSEEISYVLKKDKNEIMHTFETAYI